MILMSFSDQALLGSLVGWCLADMWRGFSLWARIRANMWAKMHIDLEPRALVNFSDEQWRDDIRRRHRNVQRRMAGR